MLMAATVWWSNRGGSTLVLCPSHVRTQPNYGRVATREQIAAFQRAIGRRAIGSAP